MRGETHASQQPAPKGKAATGVRAPAKASTLDTDPTEQKEIHARAYHQLPAG